MFCQQNKAISEFEKEMLRPVFDVERWFTFREACLRRGNKFVMPKQYIKTAGCKTFAMYCRPGRTNELVIIPIPDDLKKTHLIVSKLQKSKVDFSIQVLDSQNKLLVPPHIFDLKGKAVYLLGAATHLVLMNEAEFRVWSSGNLAEKITEAFKSLGL